MGKYIYMCVHVFPKQSVVKNTNALSFKNLRVSHKFYKYTYIKSYINTRILWQFMLHATYWMKGERSEWNKKKTCNDKKIPTKCFAFVKINYHNVGKD